jgi:parallel beta-helix repeat protein
MKKKLSASIFLAVLMLGLAASAGAVDGVIDINQAKVNVGGFPYKITTSGSYRLTGNLTGVPAGTDAIDVTAGFVTIDLNGFAIEGPGAATSTAYGINGSGGTVVENGSVFGFKTGVSTGNSGTVKSVTALLNGAGGGIVTLDNSVIENSVANLNSGPGIECNGSNCVIKDSTANSNSNGIYCYGSNCAIKGSTANSNTNVGILCYGGASSGSCVIEGCTANSNVSIGIDCTDGQCLITGNTANNTTAAGNGTGIADFGGGSLILRNIITGNAALGVNGFSYTVLGENLFYSNPTPFTIPFGKSLGNNVCNAALC